MKKVYCKNCKFTYGRDADLCRPSSLTKKAWYGGKVVDHVTSYPVSCAKVNDDNYCPYYKRKWWKVWVR